jgi:hypothetical protein
MFVIASVSAPERSLFRAGLPWRPAIRGVQLSTMPFLVVVYVVVISSALASNSIASWPDRWKRWI